MREEEEKTKILGKKCCWLQKGSVIINLAFPLWKRSKGIKNVMEQGGGGGMFGPQHVHNPWLLLSLQPGTASVLLSLQRFVGNTSLK